MNLHQVFFAQKGIGSNSADSVIAEVDLNQTREDGEDVQGGDDVDAGVHVLEVVVVAQGVVISE